MQLPDKMRLDIAIDVNYNIVSKVALFQVPWQRVSCPALCCASPLARADRCWLCFGAGL